MCRKNSGVVIHIDYPKITNHDYLLDVIKLEIGPVAALTPTEIVEIKPLCFDEFQQMFKTKTIKIKTVTPDRSFWEKTTILHREALRPSNKSIPIRYFRNQA